MAPRLFYANFDFEHRLAEPSHEPSAKLKRLNAELASAWIAIANDGDFLWTPEAIDSQFFDQLRSAGLPQLMPVTKFDVIPRATECIPWGWSHEVRSLCSRHGWTFNAPPLEAVNLANSRATSNRLEQEWSVGIPGASAVYSVDELRSRIAALPPSSDRWVVKAEFGMSARERILGRGPLLTADLNWVQRRTAGGKAVYFEPWVERVDEFGVQVEVPKIGSPTVIGIAPMEVDARGQYAGSWFQYEETRFRESSAYWESAKQIALRAAKELQSLGYFGPLGIDAMVYDDHQGTRRLRPLQDINARWTMGRLSLGLRRFCRDKEEGFWSHGAAVPLDSFTPHRQIPTSPARAGSTDCRHQSIALFGSPKS